LSQIYTRNYKFRNFWAWLSNTNRSCIYIIYGKWFEKLKLENGLVGIYCLLIMKWVFFRRG